MERNSIRQALINTFLNAIQKKNSGDAISLLAMIGVETVLKQLGQEDVSINNDDELLQEIEEIKQQLEILNKKQIKCSPINFNSPPSQSTKLQIKKTVTKKQLQLQPNNKQETALRRNHNNQLDVQQDKKKRDLTPKITESVKPVITTVNNNNQKYFRHHLDDQQMKQALVWQNTSNKNASPKQNNIIQKNQQQSLHYFIDFKQGSQPNQESLKFEQQRIDSHRQLTTSNNQNSNSTAIPQFYNNQRQTQMISQSQESWSEVSTKNNQEEFPQEKLIESHKPYKQQSFAVQKAQLCSLNVQSQRQQNIQEFQNTHFNNSKRQPWKQIQQGDICDREIQSPQFNQTQIFKSGSCHDLPLKNQKNINAPALNDISQSLINSPQARQRSQENSYENCEEEIQNYLKGHTNCQTYQQGYSCNSNINDSQEEDVRISGFDPSTPSDNQKLNESECSGNSSAFSLFNPNEELRSFFQKEFKNQDQPQVGDCGKENVDPRVKDSMFVKKSGQENPVITNKVSNVFVNGRLGGSKIF